MGKSHFTKNRSLESVLAQKGLFPSTSAPWQQDILDGLLRSVNFPRNPACLDAACGIGNNVETLHSHFAKIVAFDKSGKAVEFASNLYGYMKNKISFSVGDLETFPYLENSFDCVVCTEALEHVEDHNIVIKEIFRVTKPGGYVILSFQNHFNLSALLKFLAEKFYGQNWDVWGTHRHKEGFENYLTCFKVKRSVKEVGFISTKEIGADYLNAWFSWIPFLYKNYRILDRCPMLFLGRIPIIKYLGMDYFLLLKKP